MGLFGDLVTRFRKPDARSEDMTGRARSAGGGGGGRAGAQQGRGGGATTAAAAPEPEARLPRGLRETAALLRANGYGVLNEEKLRHAHRRDHDSDADAPGPSKRRPEPQQRQQQPQQQQQQQQQRTVRVVEPPPEQRRPAGADRGRRAAVEPSSSEDSRPARSAGARQQAQQQAQPTATQQTGMKRVRSSWKMRPLLVDEKLAVFWEGRDDAALLHYDGGEFWQWLQDCQTGAADPADGFPYPLVVQDQDLRTLLEIKPPAEGAPPGGELAVAVAAAGQAAAAKAGGETGEEAPGGIIVPTVRELPLAQRPDSLVLPPVVQRMQDGQEQPDVAGSSAAARAASAAWRSAEEAVAADPPYIRYVQPTPDDLDLAVEYDLDEEDAEWLEEFNAEAKRAKSRKGRRTLGEEWMEHLIDRMEKEYTAELQRHPEKWVVHASDPSSSSDPPAISIPKIEEVLPLDKCLQVPGINHYENVIEAVYDYWRAKHQRAGRPLIQRLWYEPPWDRRKAAQRVATAAADGGEGGAGAGEEGPFGAVDSPVALAGIRKRKMDPEEVKARFQEMRRDLEAARTLADQARKREKLKRRELQLYKEEWAARMQAIRDGLERVVLRGSRVKDPPAQLSAVWRMDAAAAAAEEYSDEMSDEALALGGPQDAAAQAEERAARLAMRRHARDAALGGHKGRRGGGAAAAQRQQAQHQAVQRPRAPSRPPPARPAAASPILHQGGNVRGPPAARGVRRIKQCVWCRSSEFHLLGCATCHRCFCFKCFQRRPGLGINNWSRAVKDAHYQCVVCRGLEVEDAPSANTADEYAAADAADATSPRRAAQQRSRQAQQRQAQTARVQAAAAAAGLPRSREEALALGMELPRGLGGAALRSYLLRMREEEEGEAEGEGGGGSSGGEEAAGPPPQPPQPQPRSQQQRAALSAREQAAAAGVPNNRAEAEAMGIEVPPGLGGAALRSFLLRQRKEAEEEGEGGEEEPAQQQQQQQQQQKQQKQAGGQEEEAAEEDEAQQAGGRKRGRPAAAAAGRRRRGASSSEGEAEDEDEGEDEPQRRPKQRKLGGAALSAHLRRLDAKRADRQAAAAGGSSSEGEESEEEGEEEEGWPYPHIPAPPRKLGGAALASYIKRQEALLAEEAEEEEEQQQQQSDSEQPATSGHGGSGGAASWPHPHIPPPHRKLGGAALRAYIKRQEALLQAAGGGGSSQSGGSSGTALGGAGSEDDSDDEITSGAATSSDEGQSEHKENRAPPAKRQRKVVGSVALAASLRKQQADAITSPPPAGRRVSRRVSREARALLEQTRRLQMRRA